MNSELKFAPQSIETSTLRLTCPFAALEELITNAIAHREYADTEINS